MAQKNVKTTMTFEKALEGLESSAESLKKEGVLLDDALKNYEEGIEYYNHCNDILSKAKQRIEVYKGDE